MTPTQKRIETPPSSSAPKPPAASHPLRATIDKINDPIGAKIRRAELEKIPIVPILGKRELESQSIALRSRAHGDEGVKTIEDFFAGLPNRAHR